MLWVPESPRWLGLHLKFEKAHDVFVWLQGSDEGVDATIDKLEADARDSALPHDEEEYTTFHIVKRTSTRRALAVGCMIEITRQLTGFDGISHFITTLYFLAGGTTSAVMELFLVLQGIAWVMNLIAVFSIDRFGRRRLTLVSLAGSAIGLIIFGLVFRKLTVSLKVKIMTPVPYDYTGPTCADTFSCIDCAYQDDCGFCYRTEVTTYGLLESVGACLPTPRFAPNASLFGPCNNGTSGAYRWGSKQCPSNREDMVLSNVGLVILFFSFAHGIGPISRTINAEMYPTWARSTGAALSGCVRWALSIVLILSFFSAQHLVGHHVGFFVFAAFTMGGFFFIMVTLPETKRRKLEDIHELFERQWDFHCCKI